MEIVIRDAGS